MIEYRRTVPFDALPVPLTPSGRLGQDVSLRTIEVTDTVWTHCLGESQQDRPQESAWGFSCSTGASRFIQDTHGPVRGAVLDAVHSAGTIATHPSSDLLDIVTLPRVPLLASAALILVLSSCTQKGESPATALPPTRAARLEFKEKKETLTNEERRADAAFNASQFQSAQKERANVGTDSDLTGFIKHATTSSIYGRGGVFDKKFSDEVPPDLHTILFTDLQPGQTSEAREVRLTLEQTTPVLAGYTIVSLLSRDTAERDLSAPATATVSHLLVSYKGATGAADTITRTKEDAKRIADDELKTVRDQNADFTKEVMDHSDDPSKIDNKGVFSDQIIGESDTAKNAFVKEFNDAIVAARPGQIIGPVETAFGYHIIRIEKKTARRAGVGQETRVSYAEVFFPTRIPGEWRDTGLTGENVTNAIARPAGDDGGYEIDLTFDAAGKKLFRDLTARNVGKQVAIFVDGQMIAMPLVQGAISNGEAIISGSFDAETAAGLARNIMQTL